MKREPELQAFWDEEGIYERLLEDNTGEKFVLHDGPPYANGDLHIGHALNKVTLSSRSCNIACDARVGFGANQPGALLSELTWTAINQSSGFLRRWW